MQCACCPPRLSGCFFSALLPLLLHLTPPQMALPPLSLHTHDMPIAPSSATASGSFSDCWMGHTSQKFAGALAWERPAGKLMRQWGQRQGCNTLFLSGTASEERKATCPRLIQLGTLLQHLSKVPAQMTGPCAAASPSSTSNTFSLPQVYSGAHCSTDSGIPWEAICTHLLCR